MSPIDMTALRPSAQLDGSLRDREPDSVHDARQASDAGLKFARAAEYGIGGIVLPCPPVVSATNVLFDDAEQLLGVDDTLLSRQSDRIDTTFQYGAISTPTVEAVATAIARIEGGAAGLLTPSGQSAILLAVAVHARRGGTLLALDSLTYSTTALLEDLAQRLQFRLLRVGTEELTSARAREVSDPFALFLEVPGGFGFEVPDFERAIELARELAVPAIVDNTWSSSVFFRPLAHGADMVVLSMSKLYGGPAGVSAGAIVTPEREPALQLRSLAALFGLNVAPDAAARLALCLPTLELRARTQDSATRTIMERLRGTDGGVTWIHPAHESHPSHARWARYFSGACSVFSLAFSRAGADDVRRALRQSRMLRAGYGWGGTCSSYYPFQPGAWRLPSNTTFRGSAFVRVYVGLEDVDKLTSDLEQVLSRVREIS